MNAPDMNVVELLLALKGCGLELSTRGKKLFVRGNQRALSPELRAELRHRKRELVQAVKQLEAGAVIFKVRHVREPRQTTAIM